MCNSGYRLRLLFSESLDANGLWKSIREKRGVVQRGGGISRRIVSEKVKNSSSSLCFRSSRYASDTYFPSTLPFQLWLYPAHLRSLQACYQTSPRFHDLFTLHPLPAPLYEFTPLGLAEFRSNLQAGQSDFSPRERERDSTQLWIVSRSHDRALIGSPCGQCDTIA